MSLPRPPGGDVRPVVHDGVRYEVTHWLEDPRSPEPMLTSRDEAILSRVNAVMRDRFIQLLHFDDDDMQDPTDLESMTEVLRANGSFTADEIAVARRIFQAPSKPLGRSGGFVVAFDHASDQTLWHLEVYPHHPQSQRLPSITSLMFEGEHLVVRDERGRVHRVDVHQRAVIESYATPMDLDVARIALRALPTDRLELLSDHIWALNSSMRCYNILSFSAHMASRNPGLMKHLQPLLEKLQQPELLDGDEDEIDVQAIFEDMKQAALERETSPPPPKPVSPRPADIDRNLQTVLDDLESIAHVHALVVEARRVGLAYQQRLNAGDDPDVLFDWMQSRELSWLVEELFLWKLSND